MKKKNDNCLVGMKCPKCKSLGPFEIVVETVALVYDDGVEETHDHEWSDKSVCTCRDCGHCARVKNFKETN